MNRDNKTVLVQGVHGVCSEDEFKGRNLLIVEGRPTSLPLSSLWAPFIWIRGSDIEKSLPADSAHGGGGRLETSSFKEFLNRAFINCEITIKCKHLTTEDFYI